MKRFLVKNHDGEEIIHFDGLNQPGDMSFCGSDLMGDAHLGWHQAIETNKKADCIFCIRLVKAAKKIKRSEYE